MARLRSHERLAPAGPLANRYRLDEVLGQGGMGTVYRAYDTLLDRPVAVKVLSDSGLGTDGRARLLREARAAAQLDHPNIVAVHDAGESDGTPFIVMHLVEGASLRDRPPVSLDETLAVARQVCAALEHAHEHGLVHRDLKPGNVLITPEGTAKLVDFGLARSADTQLTMKGALVGTVNYMAPEQALGQELDGRADLYAVGVMLYELTTGRLPFSGDDPLAVVAQHLHAPVVPARTYNAKIPAELDALIQQLLSKQPADRPGSAAAVRRALDAIGPLDTPKAGVAFVEAPSPHDRLARERLAGRERELAAPAGRVAVPPAASGRAAPPHHLPAQLTSFVGREAEVAEVRRLLSPRANSGRGARGEGDARLVTLTGPGGAGKTRLAVQVAAALLDEFSDGVFFVGLTPIRDFALVPQAIAQALGVREGQGSSWLVALTDFLRPRQLLLVLDNFEQVVEAGAMLSRLLAGAPQLEILVTSRSLLRVSGEVNYVVPPLGLPDPVRLPPLERLTHYEAVQLFAERARAVKPGFALTKANAPAVAEVCCRLDGLPLAIELAAARVRLLPPQKMLAQLGNRLHFLTGGARDLPVRQQTLRGAIDWSYNLLPAAEQTLFRRFSVFVNGCSLEAVEATCNADGTTDVVNGLESLADKSLLEQSEVSGEPRFDMLATLREYAWEKMIEAGEGPAMRDLHLQYFVRFAEEAAGFLEKESQAVWLDRLDREHGNLRSALDWALESGQVEVGLRLAEALSLFWFIRGYLTEGRERLAALLARQADDAESMVRAGLLNRAGLLARYQGDYKAARELISQGLAICRRWSDLQATGDALSNLGFVVLMQNDVAQASTLYSEALTIYRQLDNAQGIADSLSHLALISFYQDDLETARQHNEESLAIWRSQGDQQGIAWALHRLGNVILRQGDQATARRLFQQSLAIASDLGFKWGIAFALEGLASLAALQEQPARAWRLARAAAALRKAIGIPLSPVDSAALERDLKMAQPASVDRSSSAAGSGDEAADLEDVVRFALDAETHSTAAI